MAWKGKFKPRNPAKYKGDADGIVYRSSMELKVMQRLDSSKNVLWWSSEEVIVPYYDPVKRRPRRYFPDMVYCKKNPDGTETVVMVEVKPMKETVRPTHKPGKRRAKIISEELTWANNQAKWAAARSFCAENSWSFEILTEREIGKSY